MPSHSLSILVLFLAGASTLLAIPVRAEPTHAGPDHSPPAVAGAAGRMALTRQYLLERQYRPDWQGPDATPDTARGAGQAAGNNGQSRGHQLDQTQGGVSVGSLVSESAAGPETGGFNLQHAPQSNALRVDGDNFAPIQLSNINANGGSVHIGDVHKGNLYNSQIGGNQQGGQRGGSRNTQLNDQQEQGGR